MSENSRSMKGSRYRCLLATELEQGEACKLLEEICHPLHVKVTADDEYFPKGFSDSKELILTSKLAQPFFDKQFPDPGFKNVRIEVKDEWWLTPKKGGNTPNWDIVSSCSLDNGSKAIIIVEAKAHISELDRSGKKQKNDANNDSLANHISIEKAINKANVGLNAAYGPQGFSISINSHYQLSNRFAFAWKLASLRIPVILMYLGFIKAKEMGDYFQDDEDWAENLLEHSNGIIPEAVWNRDPILIGGTPIFPIYRAVDIQAKPDIVKIYPPKVVVCCALLSRNLDSVFASVIKAARNEISMIPFTFLSHACDIFADTHSGLTGSKIVEYCAAFTVRFGIDIPYSEYPFFDSPNKRTALLKNLQAFKPEQQFVIIKELCELDKWSDDPKIKDLKIKLISRYGSLFQGSECINEILIEETKHWLEGFERSKQNYLHALEKFNNGVFLRNSLDDLMLSLELLLQEIFGNSKSLENQISEVGSMVMLKGGSKEFANMFQKLVEYYTKYQNTYIKHDDRVMELEIEFIFELTSSFMKHFVRLADR